MEKAILISFWGVQSWATRHCTKTGVLLISQGGSIGIVSHLIMFMGGLEKQLALYVGCGK